MTVWVAHWIVWWYLRRHEKHACPVCRLYHKQRHQEQHGRALENMKPR